MTSSKRVKAGLVITAAVVALGGFGAYTIPVQGQITHDFNSICAPAPATTFFKGVAKGMAQSLDDSDRLRSLERDEAHRQAKLADNYVIEPRRKA